MRDLSIKVACNPSRIAQAAERRRNLWVAVEAQKIAEIVCGDSREVKPRRVACFEGVHQPTSSG
jgi:hypothetical protein